MPAKLSQEKFIEKAKLKHNNFYDYSKVEYIRAQIKVKIICPKHGEFEQQPNNHLFGQGCIKCMGDNVRSARTLTHYDFVKKLELNQPELFGLVSFKSIYEKYDNKILLGSKYGDVLISPNKLMEGVGPCISNSVDSKKYILSFIQLNNSNLFDKIIDIEEYNGVSNNIILNTIYGCVSIRADRLFRDGGFDLRSAINREEYLINYLKLHQPQYSKKNIKLLSKVLGSNKIIEFELDGIKYTSTPTTLMNGYFSDEDKKGRWNITIIERNKEEFLKIPCILYKIRLFNNNEDFFKIGITTKNVNIRLRNFPYNNEIIELITTNLYEAYILEQDLHQKHKKYKYKPLKKFGGQTECFTQIIYEKYEQ